jgi:hypothetical protein
MSHTRTIVRIFERDLRMAGRGAEADAFALEVNCMPPYALRENANRKSKAEHVAGVLKRFSMGMAL